MKWLVWLLLILNVVLFGYFKLSEPMPKGTQPGHEPVQAESMQILTPEQLAALPKAPSAIGAPASPEAVQQVACYEWGSFPSGSVARARRVLEKFGLETNVLVVAPQEAIRYWIYIPPLKNLKAAQARSDELRFRGVQDSFIVQEAQWRYAISLGVFKEEAGAIQLQEEMRSRGVLDAVKGVRNDESGQSVFLIKNVTAGVAEEIGKFRPDFPSSEIRQVPCQ
jgi:hypothetical protein